MLYRIDNYQSIREKKQRRLEYQIELFKMADKIQPDENEGEGHDSDSEDSQIITRPEYSKVSIALKALQFIIENDEDVNK